MLANNSTRLFRLLLVTFLGLTSVCGAWAGEKETVKVRAQLVFGSNHLEFGKGRALSAVEEDLEKRLKSVFQWENYWEKNQEQNKTKKINSRY